MQDSQAKCKLARAFAKKDIDGTEIKNDGSNVNWYTGANAWYGETFVVVPEITKSGLVNIEWEPQVWSYDPSEDKPHATSQLGLKYVGGSAKVVYIFCWLSQRSFEMQGSGTVADPFMSKPSAEDILYLQTCFSTAWYKAVAGSSPVVDEVVLSLPTGVQYANCFVDSKRPLYIGYAFYSGTSNKYAFFRQKEWNSDMWIDVTKCKVY